MKSVRSSISNYLVTQIVVVSILILVLALLVTYQATQRQLQNLQKSTIESMMNNLVTFININGSGSNLMRMVYSIGGNRDVKSIIIVEEEAETLQVVASTNIVNSKKTLHELAGDEAYQRILEVHKNWKPNFLFTEEHAEGIQPILIRSKDSGPQREGVAYVELDTSLITKEAKKQFLFISLMLAAVIGFAALMIHRITRKHIVLPITKIESAVKWEAIDSVALKPIAKRSDELGSVASAVKSMLQTVAMAVEGISLIDKNGVYLYLNEAYAGTAGYKAAELVGKPWSMSVHPDDLPTLNAAYKTMLETGKVVVEARGLKKDGSVFYKRVTMMNRYNSNGVFIGHYCFMQDISSRKQQEEIRQKILEKLTESNTQLERFAYIASHDMQEPIRMITNFSEIITKEYGHAFDDTGKEYLKLVVNSGRRMRDLIEDLLAYSRVDSQSMNMVSFSGENAVTGVLENLKGLIEEQNAIVTSDTMPKLYGNPVQIIRLLQNLVSNGIKYQPQGNRPQIHIGLEDEKEHWRISVKDNGIGIKSEFMEQIFQPFHRLHTWDKIKGTGLGLSICQKIANNHGGKISVTSSLGKGSVFSFTIPKHTSAESEAA